MHSWPTFINLKFDVLHYYSFLVTVNKRCGSFDTNDNNFVRICVPNKIKDMNLGYLI